MNSASSSEHIGHTLRRVRGGRSVDEIGLKTHINTISNYETGKRLPELDFLAAFSEATGADFLELLRLRLASSADAPAQRMAERLKAAAAPAFAPGGIDLARFRRAIETAEEGLAAADRVMAPDKKAELILAIYDLLEEPANTKERILKLVKLAA